MDMHGSVQRSFAEAAELIVDEFVQDAAADDLLNLENNIRLELYRAYYAGVCYGKRLATRL